MACTNSFTELERSLSNSLLNLEASNAELEKFKFEKAQLQAQLESVSASMTTRRNRDGYRPLPCFRASCTLVFIWPKWHAFCLVPRPRYCERPIRFWSRGPSENPSRSSRIRHRNALTEKAREEAVLRLGRRASKLKGKRFLFCFCLFFLSHWFRGLILLLNKRTSVRLVVLKFSFKRNTLQFKPSLKNITKQCIPCLHLSTFLDTCFILTPNFKRN